MKSKNALGMTLAALAAWVCLGSQSAWADGENDATIYPDQTQQLISWGYDVKQDGKARGLTPSFAHDLFVDDKMTFLRVPIYGDGQHPSNPAEGQLIDSYYDKILEAMANARAARPKVLFFASKKLGEHTTSFPDWMTDSDGVIPEKYAGMLADYLQYMQKHGFTIDILGVDNEMEWNKGKITPEKYKKIVEDLTALSQSRGFVMPKYLIGPESYFPKHDWLKETNELGTRLDIVGTHYYPERPFEQLKELAEEAKGRPIWHTELHKGKEDDAEEGADKTLATFFDCIDVGISGFVWWSYDPGKLMNGLERAMVRSTVDTRPIKMDSLHRELTVRAFLGDNSIAVWVLNNAHHAYDGCQFHLASGTIGGNVNYQQWTGAGAAHGKGTATPSDSSTFALDLPGGTLTEFIFPYTPDSSGAPAPADQTPVTGDTNSVPMPQ